MSTPSTSTPSRRGRPTQAEAKALDERLRAAAVSIFLENGYDGTTMEAVADAASITKRTLYARYPDKHALFVSVIPWALSRLKERHTEDAPAGDDLAAALTAVGRGAIARVVDPDTIRLRRMAMYESARFPEFAQSAESMMYSAQVRAVVAVLRQHRDADGLVIDDIELAAEQFLAMVAVMPSRLADFGIVRSPEVEDRHLEHAVALFLRAIRPD
jgi:TetR/AcrR family transcriptional repressor of mexJK operon